MTGNADFLELDWQDDKVVEQADGDLFSKVHVRHRGNVVGDSFNFIGLGTGDNANVVANRGLGFGVSSRGERGRDRSLVNDDEVLTVNLKQKHVLDAPDELDYEGAVGGKIEFSPGGSRSQADLDEGEAVVLRAYLGGELVFEGIYSTEHNQSGGTVNFDQFVDEGGSSYAGQMFDSFQLSAANGQTEFSVRDISLEVLQDVGDAEQPQTFLANVAIFGETSGQTSAQLIEKAEAMFGLADFNQTSEDGKVIANDGKTSVFAFTSNSEVVSGEDGQVDIFIFDTRNTGSFPLSQLLPDSVEPIWGQYFNFDKIENYNPAEGDTFLLPGLLDKPGAFSSYAVVFSPETYDPIQDFQNGSQMIMQKINNQILPNLGDDTTYIEDFTHLLDYVHPSGDLKAQEEVRAYYDRYLSAHLNEAARFTSGDPESLFLAIAVPGETTEVDGITQPGALHFQYLEIKNARQYEKLLAEQLETQGVNTYRFRDILNDDTAYSEHFSDILNLSSTWGGYDYELHDEIQDSIIPDALLHSIAISEANQELF